MLTRWSGDVIRKTGMKNFNAVSHNRARPYFRIQHRKGEARARRVYSNVHPVTGNVVDAEWSVEFWRWKWIQHPRPRAVVGYGVKIFLPSPPNYVTRSPGIDDIVMSGKQSVYWVDIMQILKRNASLVRRSIASSFNFSQGPGRRRRKERDCSQSGLKSLGS